MPTTAYVPKQVAYASLLEVTSCTSLFISKKNSAHVGVPGVDPTAQTNASGASLHLGHGQRDRIDLISWPKASEGVVPNVADRKSASQMISQTIKSTKPSLSFCAKSPRFWRSACLSRSI